MKTRPGAINHKQTGLLAVQISSNIMSATNISELLLQNINEPLPVKTHLEKPLTWGKIFINVTYIYKERYRSACKEMW